MKRWYIALKHTGLVVAYALTRSQMLRRMKKNRDKFFTLAFDQSSFDKNSHVQIHAQRQILSKIKNNGDKTNN